MLSQVASDRSVSGICAQNAMRCSVRFLATNKRLSPYRQRSSRNWPFQSKNWQLPSTNRPLLYNKNRLASTNNLLFTFKRSLSTTTAAREGYSVTCPGQGIIQPGLLVPFKQYQSSILKPVLEQIDETLQTKFTTNLFNPDEEFAHDWLMQTSNAQPAILATSYIISYLYSHLRGPLIDPQHTQYVMGHSLGEYTALLLTGVLDLPAALKLVATRGMLMQELSKTSSGAMMALLIRPSHLDALTQHFAQLGILANVNSPSQLVVSSPSKQQLEHIVSEVQQQYPKSIMKKINLPVRVAFHHESMAAIEPQLLEQVDFTKIKDPVVPIISNLNAHVVKNGKSAIQNTIAVNSKPVQWVNSMRVLENSAAERPTVVNLGPGQVLQGLNSKFKVDNIPMADLESIQTVTI